MFILQLIISGIVASNVLGSQVAAYNRIIPYDPRYMIRRMPVRRSVDLETRMQPPITRYFPQVDAQVAPYPYVAQENVAPAAYRLSNGDVYVVPSRWSEDAVPISNIERNDDADYGTYEYDSDLTPVYGRPYQSEPYALQPDAEVQDSDGDLYNDMMVNYFLSGLQPELDENEYAEVQRRSPESPIQYVTVEEQKREEIKVQNDSESAKSTQPTTVAPASQETSTIVQVSSSPAAAAPEPASTPSALKMRPQIQRHPQFIMARRSPAPQNGQWSPFIIADKGQKEYPFYRQTQSISQKSPMASLEEQMSRGKNTGGKGKDAFSLIEKMMSSQQAQDPLTEQLESLKFRNM